MTDGLPVGRVFGIVIRIHWSWVLILALVAALASAEVSLRAPGVDPVIQWVIGAIVAAGFFISAAAHDLGHAIVSRRRGLQVDSIVVSFFGGSSPLDPTARTPADELAIAAAGPLVSLAGGVVLVGSSAILSAAGGASVAAVLAAALLFALGLLNVLLGLVNLVPAYPLDGGRLLRAMVWARSGSERAGSRMVARSGSLLGAALIVAGAVAAIQDLGDGMVILLSGWFLRSTARTTLQRVQLEELADGLRVGDVMEPRSTPISPGLTVDTFADQLLDGDPPRTAVLVARDGELVGLVGVAQLRRLRRSAWPTTRVEEIMIPAADLPLLRVDAPVWPAFLRLREAGLDGAPVAAAADEPLGPEDHAGLLTVRGIAAAIQARRPSGSSRLPVVR